MKELPSQGKYDLEKFKKQLVEAVGNDKWLPIISPPHDFKEIDPRKAEVLKRASTILGRLAVAAHAIYEEIYKDGYTPLLKADKENGRFQYLTQTQDPNYYYLVFLKGTTPGWRSKKQLLCENARFILIPESRVQNFQNHFLQESYGDWLDYVPIVGSGYNAQYVSEAKAATTFVFDKSGQITKLGNYVRKERFFVSSYEFEPEKSNARVSHYSSNYLTDKYLWECNSIFVLNQDGILRSSQSEVDKTPLDESLLTITTNLPLIHFIDTRNK